MFTPVHWYSIALYRIFFPYAMLLDCIYRPQETNHNVVWAGRGKNKGEGDKTSGY